MSYCPFYGTRGESASNSASADTSRNQLWLLLLSQDRFKRLTRIQNIQFVMHLLKSMGGGAASAKPGGASAKSSYFSSLKLDDEKPKQGSTKQKEKTKKAVPPKGFLPQKFALDFNPPCIVLEYRDPESNKLFHHKMKIKKLKKETSAKEALDYLKKKHYHFFIPKVIDEVQIEKLIEKLKNGLVGQNRSQIEDVDEEDDFEFDYDDDFQD